MILHKNIAYLLYLISFGFISNWLNIDPLRDIMPFINKMIATYPAEKVSLFQNFLHIRKSNITILMTTHNINICFLAHNNLPFFNNSMNYKGFQFLSEL